MHRARFRLRLEILLANQGIEIPSLARRLVQYELAFVAGAQFGHAMPHPIVARRKSHGNLVPRDASLVRLSDLDGGFPPVGVVLARRPVWLSFGYGTNIRY